jgi:hypothetical protein
MTLEQRSANDGDCPYCQAEIELKDGYEVEVPQQRGRLVTPLAQRLRTNADATADRTTRLLMYQAADKIEQLQALVELARNTYLQDYSDGETDCVTPYDVYN